VQVGPSAHFELGHHILRNINHSCEPNVVMRGRVLLAHRSIAKNEELTLDYNCSEEALAGGTFRCMCGAAAGCVGEIRGYRYLSAAQRAERAERCQSWLLELGLPGSGCSSNTATAG
jgi:hypothetical protein